MHSVYYNGHSDLLLALSTIHSARVFNGQNYCCITERSVIIRLLL